MKKFAVVMILISLLVCNVYAGGASESPENYPTKPITLYVGAKAGGGTDVLVRILAPEMEKILGQSINIVNKEGGAGTLGNLEVVNARGDGYTIGVLTDFETIGNLLSGSNIGYTKDSMKFIGSVNASTNVLILGKDFAGERTIDGFVEYCKSHPGNVTVATSSTAQRMVMQSLASEADINFTCVPFSGGPESLNALLGGQVDAGFLAPSLSIQAEENGCTTIACASHERFSLLPDIPTMVECGYDVINNETTRIFFVPADTPDYVVQKLESALREASDTVDFKASLERVNEMYSFKTAAEATEAFNEKYTAIESLIEEYPGLLGN